MRMTQTKSKNRAGANQPEMLIALAIVGGIVLLIALGAVLANRLAPSAAPAAAAGEIVSGKKITAVHAMGDGPRIDFLPAGDPQPNITLPETFYDFGSIGAQDVASRTFLVRNTGEAPLTISRAYTTCGCTTAEISAEVIPPGKAVTVELRFDAGFHDSAGQTVRRGVILENNDPDQPQAEIWVQAQVASK